MSRRAFAAVGWQGAAGKARYRGLPTAWPVIADSNREVAERRETGREEAALRRIATVVAEGVQPHELFAVVAEEVARVVDAPSVGVARYEPDGTATACGAFPPLEAVLLTGARVSLEG